MNNLSNLLGVCGISNVYWIDDVFSSNRKSSDERNAENILQELVVEPTDFDRLLDQLSHTSSDARGSALSYIRDRQYDTAFLADPTIEANICSIYNELFNTQELEPKHFEGITRILGDIDGITFKRFSFDDWAGSTEKNDITNNVLLLVDLENKNTSVPNPKEGLDLLGNIYACPDNVGIYSILLTHTCTKENEHDRMLEHKSEFSGKNLPFSVLSKHNFHDIESLESLLTTKLTKTLFTYVFSVSVVTYRDYLIQGMRDLADELMKQKPNDLYKYWFDSSKKEGISEDALIKRLLSSPSIMYQQGNIDLLLKLRGISQNEFTNDYSHSSEDTVFHKIRKNEIWYDGSILNPQFAPLEHGDIFEDNGNNQYILVAGPCDIAVRITGKRKKNTAYLLPIKQRTVTMSKLVDHKLSGGKPETKEQQAYIKDLLPNNNRLIFLEEHNAYYYADISKAFLCHLDILEWCSFNDTGTLRLSSELESSKNFLLHGWQKKLESHLEKLSSNPLDTYKSLQVNILGENLKTDLCVSLNEGALEVKLRRTKRLRAPFIELLQTKYHQYLSRKAFDHDFLNT